MKEGIERAGVGVEKGEKGRRRRRRKRSDVRSTKYLFNVLLLEKKSIKDNTSYVKIILKATEHFKIRSVFMYK